MAKSKKKIDVNSEEHKREQHRLNLEKIEDRLRFIPEPTCIFEIGEEVGIGNLKDVVVHSVLHDGKVIEVDYTYVDNNYGNPISHEHEKGYWTWMDVRKINDNEDSIIVNDDIRLNYSQTHLRGLFGKVYYFGVNFDPEYQREYVWDKEDKVKLIDSIYNNVDIGKFAFIHLDSKRWQETGFGYEVLDGKQRLRAIMDFYEGRIKYKGFYYNQLSRRDQGHFVNYSVNVAEVNEVGREQVLRYFLMLNTGGRIMSEDHLNKVRQLLEDISIK